MRVWVDPPIGATGMEDLTSRFGQYFERNWHDVMSDAEMSFNYHLGWKGFYAVSGLEKIRGIPTSLFTLYDTGASVGLNYDRKPVLIQDDVEDMVVREGEM